MKIEELFELRRRYLEKAEKGESTMTIEVRHLGDLTREVMRLMQEKIDG